MPNSTANGGKSTDDDAPNIIVLFIGTWITAVTLMSVASLIRTLADRRVAQQLLSSPEARTEVATVTNIEETNTWPSGPRSLFNFQFETLRDGVHIGVKVDRFQVDPQNMKDKAWFSKLRLGDTFNVVVFPSDLQNLMFKCKAEELAKPGVCCQYFCVIWLLAFGGFLASKGIKYLVCFVLGLILVAAIAQLTTLCKCCSKFNMEEEMLAGPGTLPINLGTETRLPKSKPAPTSQHSESLIDNTMMVQAECDLVTGLLS